MEFVGYFFSFIIGITLGLFGSGGSILMVPVMVYIFKIEASNATYFSLFIVGITSLIGAIRYYINKLISFSSLILFSIPSAIGVLFARKIMLPFIPDHIGTIQNLTITKNFLLMILFALLMISAAVFMIRGVKTISTNSSISKQRFTLLFVGFLVGILTGLIGAGGGFIIIPALIFLLNFDMKSAVGTSLSIICINTLVGFFSDFNFQQTPLEFLLSICFVAILGIIIGSKLTQRIQSEKLKPYFGGFILIMGIYIIINEIFLQ